MAIRKITGQTSSLVVSATTTRSGIYKAAAITQNTIQRLQNLSSKLIPKTHVATSALIDHLLYDPYGFEAITKFYNRNLIETYELLDRLGLLLQRPTQDSFGLTSDTTLKFTIGRGQSEPGLRDLVVPADDLLLTFGFTRSPADVTQNLDRNFLLVSTSRQDQQTVEDTALSLFIGKMFADSTVMEDTMALFDGLTYTTILNKTETTAAEDQLIRTFVANRVFRSEFTLDDFIQLVRGRMFEDDNTVDDFINYFAHKALGHGTELLDALALITNINRVFEEISEVQETKSLNPIKGVADFVGLEDIFFSVLVKALFFDDVTTILDSTQLGDHLTYDALKLVDELAAIEERPYLFVHKPVIDDANTLTDASSLFIDKPTAEQIATDEQNVKYLHKVNTEVLSIEDLISLTRLLPGLLFAHAQSVEDTDNYWWLNKQFADAVTADDPLVRLTDGSMFTAIIQKQDLVSAPDYFARAVHWYRYPHHGFLEFTTYADTGANSPFVPKQILIQAHAGAQTVIPLMRTNRILWSENFDNSYWSKLQVSVSSNAIAPPASAVYTAAVSDTEAANQVLENYYNQPQNSFGTGWFKIATPAGYSWADAIYETNSSSTHYVQSAAIPELQANGKYAFSVYLKYLNRRYIRLSMLGSGQSTNFDILNGTVTTSNSERAEISLIGNGWYLCKIYNTENTSSTHTAIIQLLNDSQSVSYAGNSSTGVYVWGTQLETGPQLIQEYSSFNYIHTTDRPVSRLGYRVMPNDLGDRVWIGSLLRDGTINRISGDPFERMFYFMDKSFYESAPSNDVTEVSSGIYFGVSLDRTETLLAGSGIAGNRVSGSSLESTKFLIRKTAKQGDNTLLSFGNLIANSEDLSVSWLNARINISSNLTTAPNGTVTADKILATSSYGAHYVYVHQVPLTSGTVYTFSTYAKAAEHSSVSIWIPGNAFGAAVIHSWDLNNGNLLTSTASTYSVCNRLGYGSEYINNGWYRCWVTAQTATDVAASSSAPFVIALGSSINDATTSYVEIWAGSSNAGIFVWGAQLEASPALGNYVRTTGSASVVSNTPASTDRLFIGTAISGNRVSGDKLENFSNWYNLDAKQGRNTLRIQGNMFTSSNSANTWIQVNATVSSNVIAAPDGSVTADKIRENATSSNKEIYQTVAIHGNTTYVMSAYVKAGETNALRFGLSNSVAGTNSNCYFNLSSLTVVSSTVAWITGSVTDAGNGWRRCVGVFRPQLANSTTSLNCYITLCSSNTTTTTYVGVTGSGIYVWGMQLQADDQAGFLTATDTVSSTLRSNYANDRDVVYTGTVNDFRASGDEYENLRFWFNRQSADETTMIDSFSFGDEFTFDFIDREFDYITIGTGQTSQTIRPPAGSELENFSYFMNKTALQGVSSLLVLGNLYSQSELITASDWNKGGLTVTSAGVVAPQGSLAYRLTEIGATTSQHLISQTRVPNVTGATITNSCWAKYDGVGPERQLLLTLWGEQFVAYDLVAGTVIWNPGNYTVGMTNAGNGWYRCWMTMKKTVGFSGNAYVGMWNKDAGLNNYIATTGTILVAGPQLEISPYLGNYVATYTANSILVTNTKASSDVVLAGTLISGPRVSGDVLENVSYWLHKDAKQATPTQQLGNLIYTSTNLALPGINGWVTSSCYLTPNATLAPDSSLTAVKINEFANTANHYLSHGYKRLYKGRAYTYSIYVKAAERSEFRMTMALSSFNNPQFQAYFDLSAVTVVTTLDNASIEDVGNGWRRCTMSSICTTGALPSGSTTFTVYPATGVASNYTGVTGSGIYVWGPQLEMSAVPSDYVATTSGAIITHEETDYSADVIDILDHNHWYLLKRISLANNDTETVTATVTDRSSWVDKLAKQGTNTLVQWGNAFLNSENFSNSSWATSRVSISSNVTVAPNGTLTADRLTEDTALGVHYIRAATVGISTGAAVILSVHVKQDPTSTTSFAHLMVADSTALNGIRLTADLNTETIAVAKNVEQDFIKITDYGIRRLDQGWYRIWVGGVVDQTSTGVRGFIYVSNSSSATVPNYTGDGISGLYYWGAQLELRPTLGDYVATTASTSITYVRRADQGDAVVLGSLPAWTDNLITSSEQINLWTNSNVIISSNVTVAPNGTATAESLIDTAAAANHQIIQNISSNIVPGKRYTASTYVKQYSSSTNWIMIYIQQTGSSGFAFAHFYPPTGQVGTVTATTGLSTQYNNLSAISTPVGAGWHRISLSVDLPAASSLTVGYRLKAVDSGISGYSGTGNGVYIWGNQLSIGELNTYVQTTGSQITYNNATTRFSGATLENTKFSVDKHRRDSVNNISFGYMLMQSYTLDPWYFLEDYVGMGIVYIDPPEDLMYLSGVEDLMTGSGVEDLA